MAYGGIGVYVEKVAVLRNVRRLEECRFSWCSQGMAALISRLDVFLVYLLLLYQAGFFAFCFLD